MASSLSQSSSGEYPLRDLTTCDFERLKQSHKLLPIAYDNDFFIKVCSKELFHFGLCAEGRKYDSTLAGFATARQVGVTSLCYNDRRALSNSGIPITEDSQLVYVLTIGVDPECRRRRLAHSLMQGIVREALHRECAAVLLHTPTNNVAACGLYSRLDFVRLRKHLSFYSIPAPSVDPSFQVAPTLQPAKPAPLYLDAYLFGRSTQVPIGDRLLDSAGSHTTDIQPTPQSRVNVHHVHVRPSQTRATTISTAQRSMNGHRCSKCGIPCTCPESAGAPAGPCLQFMHQSAQHHVERDMMREHAYTDEPVLATTQISLLADVGFSGALVRSTEAAGVAIGMVSSWLGNSCAAGPHAYLPASPPPAEIHHTDTRAVHTLNATARVVRRAAASGIEVPLCGSRTAQAGGSVDGSSQRLLPELSKDALCASAALDESSTATPNSDVSAVGWLEGHNGGSVYQPRGVVVAKGGYRAQKHVSAAADLTFFQRMFGRP